MLKNKLYWEEGLKEGIKNSGKFNWKDKAYLGGVVIVTSGFFIVWLLAHLNPNKKALDIKHAIWLLPTASIFVTYFVSFLTWYCPRRIQISEEGITIMKYTMNRLYRWREIESIEIENGNMLKFKPFNAKDEIIFPVSSRIYIDELEALIYKNK